MESGRFDELTARLAVPLSRRRSVGLLSVIGLGGLAASHEADARRRREDQTQLGSAASMWASTARTQGSVVLACATERSARRTTRTAALAVSSCAQATPVAQTARATPRPGRRPIAHLTASAPSARRMPTAVPSVAHVRKPETQPAPDQAQIPAHSRPDRARPRQSPGQAARSAVWPGDPLDDADLLYRMEEPVRLWSHRRRPSWTTCCARRRSWRTTQRCTTWSKAPATLSSSCTAAPETFGGGSIHLPLVAGQLPGHRLQPARPSPEPLARRLCRLHARGTRRRPGSLHHGHGAWSRPRRRPLLRGADLPRARRPAARPGADAGAR